MNIDNVNKFNKEATKLLKKYKGKAFFVTEETIEKNKEQMRMTSDLVLEATKEVFNICVKQNISAIDSKHFGNFIIDMTKLYWNNFGAITNETQQAESQPIGESNEHSN
jgi:hypothetical protein